MYGTATLAALDASLNESFASLFTLSSTFNARPSIMATSCLVAFAFVPFEVIKPGISFIVTILFSRP